MIPLGRPGLRHRTSSAGTQNPNDDITALKKQLQASPGTTAVMVALAQAYQLAAGQQATGSAQQKTDYTDAAAYYRQYRTATKDQKAPQALRTRIETLQMLATVYSNAEPTTQRPSASTAAHGLQPEERDLLRLGKFAVSAGQHEHRAARLHSVPELAPNVTGRQAIKDWMQAEHRQPRHRRRPRPSPRRRPPPLPNPRPPQGHDPATARHPFSVTSEVTCGTLGLVALTGEVDIYTAPRFKDACSSCSTAGSRTWSSTSPG